MVDGMVVWSVFSWRGIRNNMERGMQVPGRHSSKFGLLVHRQAQVRGTRRSGAVMKLLHDMLERSYNYFTSQDREGHLLQCKVF